MINGDILSIQPTELKFPFELKKQSSCSLQLINKTEQYVAFKVKTTNPKKYSVRPNTGIVLPGSACNVTVTMQAQKEAPLDFQCKDKFLLQSVVANHSTTTKDITPDMFSKEDGKVVEEVKLRVVYIPANPPSPVPEGSEEGNSPRASLLDNGNQNSLFDAVSRSVDESSEKKSEELLRKEISKSHASGFSFVFVVVIGILGILFGFLVKVS
ncbi:vesicle-associated protein 1-3-like isoform X2 [Tasmannia lanceolata]|uniref:vesicle-associated protein 1-3-like isoform X2 n=1 Tax=Tasmannia lanceolata TaxID=3420 RepID=UPI004064B8B8